MAAVLHLLDQRRLIDSNGIADGGSIAFYLTGTTTPSSIYSDAGLTTPLTNPVVVGAGAAVPDIYLDDAITYRRVITYPDGSTDDTDPYVSTNPAFTLSYVTPEMYGAAATADDLVDDQPFVQLAIDAAVAAGVPLRLLRDYNIWKPATLNRGYRARLTATGPLALIGDEGLVQPTLNFLGVAGGDPTPDATQYYGLQFVRPGGAGTREIWSFKSKNMRWEGNWTYGTWEFWHKPFIFEEGVNLAVDLDFDHVEVKSWGGEMFYGVSGYPTLDETLLFGRIPYARLRDVRCIESGLNLMNFGGHQYLDIDGLYLTKGAIAECILPQGATIRNVFAENVSGGVFTGGNYPDYPLPNIFWGNIQRDGTTPLVTLENFVVKGSTGNLRFGSNVHGTIDVTDCAGELGIFPQQRISNIKLKVRHTLDQLADDTTTGFTLYSDASWDSEEGADGDYTAPKSSANASFSGSTMTLNSIVSATISTIAGNIQVADVGHNVAAGTSGGRTALNPLTRIVAQLTGTAGGPGTYTIDPPVAAPIASQTVTIGQLTEPLSDVQIDLELCRTPNAVLNDSWFYYPVVGAGPVLPDTVRITVRGEGTRRAAQWGLSTLTTEIGNLPFIDDQAVFKSNSVAASLFGQLVPISGSGTIYLTRPRVLLQPDPGTFAITLADVLPDPTGGNGAHSHAYSQGQRILMHNGGSGTLTFASGANQTFPVTISLAPDQSLEIMYSDLYGWCPVGGVNAVGGLPATLGVTGGGTGTSTAFTAGSIVFAGASGVYSQDNAHLFYDDATNTLSVSKVYVGGSSGNIFTWGDGATQNVYASVTSGAGAAGSFNLNTNNGGAHTWQIAGVEYARLNTTTLAIAGTVESTTGGFKFPDATTQTTAAFRNVPQSGSAKTSSYPLATTDVGKFIEVGSGGSITVPDATFAAGDIVSIFNNTSGNITLTMSITTAYIGGTDADKATMTLATRGTATVLFISGTACVVSGNVS